MKTHIVVHLLPHEIDWFEWQSLQFKIGSYYLNPEDKIIIDTTLNLNLVDWKKSQIPKQFFIDKFNQIKKLWDWAETQFVIDDDNKCMGCDDKRREAVRSTTSDNILYLDCDVIFKPEHFFYLIESSKKINIDYYIISPEIMKMWDNSWDSLVNKNFINLSPNLERYRNVDPFKIVNYSFSGDVNLKSINYFKFGGGWFNLLSTKLLKLTDIPDSFGPYGVDDTYVMLCCDIMKNCNYNIQQFVLEEVIVIENFKYRHNPYQKYLHLIDKQLQFKRHAEANLLNELEKFKNKILC